MFGVDNFLALKPDVTFRPLTYIDHLEYQCTIKCLMTQHITFVVGYVYQANVNPNVTLKGSDFQCRYIFLAKVHIYITYNIFNLWISNISCQQKNFIFVDFFNVKVVKVGMLLVRNGVCNREIYDSLVIKSCIFMITKGILVSNNMPNRCSL